MEIAATTDGIVMLQMSALIKCEMLKPVAQGGLGLAIADATSAEVADTARFAAECFQSINRAVRSAGGGALEDMA